MAANLQIYTSDGLTLVTSITLTGHSPGGVSGEQTFRLVNDDSGGAVDTATEPAIILRSEDEDGDLVSEGVRPLDERWVEIKRTGVGTAEGVLETGWTPVGSHRWMTFAELESGEYEQFKIRENRPGSGPSGAITYDIQAEPGQLAQTLGLGHSDGYRDGVLTGLGDGTWGELIYTSGDVTAQGSPDDTVQLPDLAWRCAGGEPRVLLTDALTIDDVDGSAGTLVAGEAYYDVLSLAADGTITETKGDKATTPLDPDTDAPAVPAGEIPLARVHREFDGTIESADIVQLYTLGAFQLVTSSASLNVTLGAGRAIVDNRLIRRTAESVLALSASETSHIWLLPSGTFSVTEDASRPESGALLLWIAVTDGSGVTSTTDRREWIGGEMHLLTAHFHGNFSASGDPENVTWPFNRAGYIWPIRGVAMSVLDNASGNSAGELRVNVEATDGAGGAFTTLYTSQGTDDRRAMIEYDSTEPLAFGGLHEVVKIEPGARIRMDHEFTVAYDVNQPEDLDVVLKVFLV